jgi:hypothetical protein
MPKTYRYQALNAKDEKFGSYTGASPSTVAKKMAKQLYEAKGLHGEHVLKLRFVKNRTIAEGGDVVYNYRARIVKHSRPIVKTIAGKPVNIWYQIEVKPGH